MSFLTRPANNTQPSTTGAGDTTLDLFSAGYIDGIPLNYPDMNPPGSTEVPNPANLADDPSETDWVADDPQNETPPVKDSGPANGRVYYWDGKAPLPVQLHNGKGILAIWLPQEPPQVITVFGGMGASGGIGLYNTTPYTAGEQVASEMIGIPSGHETLVLQSAAPFDTPIFVLISGEPYQPSKTFLSTITSSSITASITLPVQLQAGGATQPVSFGGVTQPVVVEPPGTIQTISGVISGAGVLLAASGGKRIFVLAYSLDWTILTSVGATNEFGFDDSVNTIGGVQATVPVIASPVQRQHQLSNDSTPIWASGPNGNIRIFAVGGTTPTFACGYLFTFYEA